MLLNSRQQQRERTSSSIIGQQRSHPIHESNSGIGLIGKKGRSRSTINSSTDHAQQHYPSDYGTMTPELTFMFFAYKNESFNLRKNYKKFNRLLKNTFSCNIIPLQEDLGDGLLPFSSLVVIAGINVPLTQVEVGLLLEYVDNGGSVFVLAEASKSPDIYNVFTQHYGISVVNDAVISVIRKQQYHPKECYVSKAVICPMILPQHGTSSIDDDEPNLNILYTNGCSLEVANAGVPIIASGMCSYPSSRPLGAIYYSPESKGRVLVFGSGHSFSDPYFDAEDNKRLLEIFLDLLLAEELPELVPRDIDLKEHEDIHCTGYKASRYRGVLQDIDDYIFPSSVTPLGMIKPMSLVSSKLNKMDYSILPDVFKAYEQLKVDRVPLSQTVKPQFEVALPPLKLAIFPPTFRPLPPPPLELFDLDEEFSSNESRLGRVVNKCSEDDLEFCIESLGNICGINVKGKDENVRAKAILMEMWDKLSSFKMPMAPLYESSTVSSLSMIEEKYFCDQEEDLDDKDEYDNIQS